MFGDSIPSTHLDILHTIKGRNRIQNYCCCQCFVIPDVLLRCSRCEVTQYCSKGCQKRHYTVHRKGCITIHKMQNSSTDEDKNLNKLGDLVFQIAYRSCDTVERGAFMYEKALDYYVQYLIGLENKANDNPSQNAQVFPKNDFSSMYDRVRFMLVALHHREAFLVSISATSILDNLFSRDATHNSTIQIAIGLFKMNLISDIRSGQNDSIQKIFGTNVVTDKYLDEQLSKQVTELTQCLQLEPKLWSAVLDRSGNLSESTCPQLFAPHPPGGTLRELYCFVQDCFFLDRRISLVLDTLPDVEDYQGI
jgi:hypothetical protein